MPEPQSHVIGPEGEPIDLTRYLGTKQVARAFGTSQRYVQQLAERGQLPVVEIQMPGAPWRTRLFDREAVEAFAANRQRILEAKRAMRALVAS